MTNRFFIVIHTLVFLGSAFLFFYHQIPEVKTNNDVAGSIISFLIATESIKSIGERLKKKNK